MIVSLEETKTYLRVDGDAENTLITDFIRASEDICEGILRRSLEDFEEVPETVRQAVLFSVGQFYEHRESLDVKLLTEMVRRLLFSYRSERW
jgi:uncharacterized phage protein (predicted DNA packaging)